MSVEPADGGLPARGPAHFPVRTERPAAPAHAAGVFVRVVCDQGTAHVELVAPGVPPVRLQPHPNPCLADAEADQLRAALAAVICAARGDTNSPPVARIEVDRAVGSGDSPTSS